MIWILGARGIPARYGGFETLAEQLSGELNGAGFECRVIGTTDPATVARPLVRLLRRFGPAGAVTPVATWLTRPTVDPGDRVLVVNPVNVWTARSLHRRGALVLLHLDGMEDQRAKWGAIGRAVHRLARRSAIRSDLTLIADSREIQRHYLSMFRRPTEYVAYGGCSTAERDDQHRWESRRVGDHFLVMARPEPENQVLEICSAFSSSQVAGRLLVVGGPSHVTPYWRSIERAAARDPRIELLGSVWDRDRLCSLMMSARAYLHGHTVGGTNPSLVDVLSHGTPVLAHDNAFNREVIGANASVWTSAADLVGLLNECHTRPPGTSDRANQATTWAATTLRYRALLQLGASDAHQRP